MFRVTATSVEDYFTFDRTRESDLRSIDATLQKNYISLYCSARDSDRPFVLAYKKALGEIDVSATGVIRFGGVEQLDIDGLGTMVRDLEKGLAAKRLSLRYGRAAKTAAKPRSIRRRP